ncbi:MAG: phosphoribosylamine--glycine ligase [Verrucomicrobia bacterium]|nr:MAG: phosphoribosylamine--glycine ligase [Verrucomicrobiota bacterium]
MKVLILGGGGREHALAWKLSQSPRVRSVFCAPGNGGIGSVAKCVPIKLTEVEALARFAEDEGIGLTVVGPDDALAAGVVDRFTEAGLRIFGPRQAAARLESSKVFAKEFMQRHGIPTAHSGHFNESSAARAFAETMALPVVLKADGLALGKGVIIAQTRAEVEIAITQIMDERKFGDAGKAIVIEEFLEGPECSIHALVDGKSYLLFPSAQDHKRALDNDEGLNTGGMGTYSPVSQLTPALEAQVRTQVLDRFIAGLKADGLAYKGMLFPGLMLTKDGIKVLEFNCRFGDPETQVLLTRLESDLLDLLEATIDGTLAQQNPRWKPGSAVCVIAASGGYPEAYESGKVITGLDEAAAHAVVFHAGTRLEGGALKTAGGRVLGLTATGANLQEARDKAYTAADSVHFEGVFFRRDIGARGLAP